MTSTDVEKLLRQEHIRPEELLTDGPNNRLNLLIHTEDTTVENTKGNKTGANVSKKIRICRKMIVTKHEDVLRVFFPIIAFGGALILFLQSLTSVVIIFTSSLSE